MADTTSGLRICQCGCGQPTISQRTKTRFRPGHGARGWARSEEHKRRVAAAQKELWAGKKVPGKKVCGRCKELKDATEFGYRKDGHYLRSECRPCAAIKVAALRNILTPEQRRAAAFKASIYVEHGIRLEDYERVLASQGGGCAICGRTDASDSGRQRRLFIDHCHATNEIRGILCSACNSGIGHFADRIDLLMRAVVYLQTSRTGLKHSPRRGLRGGRGKTATPQQDG